MADVELMSFAVSSNGKEFEVDIWIGVTLRDEISSKDIHSKNIYGLRRKGLTHIDIISIEIYSK